MFYNILTAVVIVVPCVLAAWELEQESRANAEAWAEYIAWLMEPEAGKHFRR